MDFKKLHEFLFDSQISVVEFQQNIYIRTIQKISAAKNKNPTIFIQNSQLFVFDISVFLDQEILNY